MKLCQSVVLKGGSLFFDDMKGASSEISHFYSNPNDTSISRTQWKESDKFELHDLRRFSGSNKLALATPQESVL
jgi:hypothetical protein